MMTIHDRRHAERRAVVARLLVVLLVMIVALAATATPSAARHLHSGVFIGVGPLWWDPYWLYGPPYWPYAPYWSYPPYAYPPPVVVEEPPVYVQQTPAAPAPPDGPYWYYCASARAYYPTVQTCPEAWMKIPPRPE